MPTEDVLAVKTKEIEIMPPEHEELIKHIAIVPYAGRRGAKIYRTLSRVTDRDAKNDNKTKLILTPRFDFDNTKWKTFTTIFVK